jgi:anti-sigma-K factor RskA
VNIKEYISSGILEAYVLGELSSQEIAEVERNLVAYPELKEELERVEEAHENLLMAVAVQPPASVKQKLFEKIGEPGEAKVVELKSENVSMWKFAAAASISVALISSVLAYNYWNKWQSASDELTALIAMNQRVAKDYNQVNKRLDELANDIKVMDNPAFSRVVMKGTEQAPEALASVYWNAGSQEVYLRIQNMKALATESQYQLWAIIDGKPVDAGVFDPDQAGLIKMKNIAAGATNFAVTIEPRGGKTSPSLETMQVIGAVQKSS